MQPKYFLAAALLVATGCNVNNPSPPGGPVSFASQIQPILSDRCVTCHRPGGLATSAGVKMDLRDTAAPASLINQPSSLNDTLTLVIPGDAANSLLYKMVTESSPPVGVRMPPGFNPLTGQQLGLIRDWINQGALDN